MILSIPSDENPLDSLVIFYYGDVPVVLASQKNPYPFRLTLPELKGNQTVGRYFARNRFNQSFDNRQSIFSPVESEGGIELYLALQSWNISGGDVWKIRHYQMKRAINPVEQIRTAERDSIWHS